jgi:hypothetical protein
LHEDPVNLLKFVERAYKGEQIVGGRGFRRSDSFAVDTEFVAGACFIADVDLRSRVIADEDDGESGRAAFGLKEPLYAWAALRLDLIADEVTV